MIAGTLPKVPLASEKSTILSWLRAQERWLPAVAGLLWWATFHPGFISEDSIVNLNDARSGAISVWFTASWIYVVDLLTLGTRAISLLTLLSVVGLEYAVYFWIVTVFPKNSARAVTVLFISLSPIVGAMGIQIRHDAALTSGLLICAVVLIRTATAGPGLRDYAWFLLAMPLIATRHNGVPTIAAAAVFVLMTGRRHWRQAAALTAVAAGAAVITFAATKASGNATAADPIQTVEWLMGDISCALGRGRVEPTEGEWATLTRIAGRDQWPQLRACRVMNPMLIERLANESAIVTNYRELIGVWRSLLARHPIEMIAAHASRVRLFLPPVPPLEIPTFIHSTIVPNGFGLGWTFPALAERARVVVRAWNAMGFILANSMVWLLLLIVVTWHEPTLRTRFAPTVVIAVALTLGLLAAAPISEGRYGLFILICGQATALYAGLRAKILA